MSNSLRLDEINEALGSAIFDQLSTDSNEAKDMATMFGDFVSTSGGKLSGPGWESVNAKMTEFQTALSDRMKLATEFGDAIKAALELCQNFLQEDPAVESLDAQDLTDIEEAMRQAESDIAEITGYMNKTHQVEIKDADGNPTGEYRTEYVYDDTFRSNCQKKIDELNESIRYAKKLIAKIEKMDSVYNEAMSMLEEAYSAVRDYGSTIRSLNPSGRFVYNKSAAMDYSFLDEKEEETTEDPTSRFGPEVSHTTGPDGTEYIEYESGVSVTKYPDGRVETRTPYNEAEGLYNSYETYPDGRSVRVIHHGDGTATVIQDNGDGTYTYYDVDVNTGQEIPGSAFTDVIPEGGIPGVQEATPTPIDEPTETPVDTSQPVVQETIQNTDGTHTDVYSDGSRKTYRQDGSLSDEQTADGHALHYDEQGRITSTQSKDGQTVTTYYPDGSVKTAKDISGQEYTFLQGENVRTVPPVSETPVEYYTHYTDEGLPPNTSIDDSGNIVIRDDHGVILNVLHPEYVGTENNGTDIIYQDPRNGNTIIIHESLEG